MMILLRDIALGLVIEDSSDLKVRNFHDFQTSTLTVSTTAHSLEMFREEEVCRLQE